MSFLDSLFSIGPQGAIATAVFSIVGSLVWLLFWLQEDWRRPEPKGLIALTFLYGGLSTAFVLPIQLSFASFLGTSTLFLIVISISEELFKYLAAWRAALRRPEFDEPIDALIYLITAAVGFTAVENALYLITASSFSETTEIVIFGIERIVTPTVLHIVVSGIVGFSLALGFYRTVFIRTVLLTIGLVAAIILHTIFNYLILNTSATNFLAISVWISAIIIIFLFEYAKRIKPKPPIS